MDEQPASETLSRKNFLQEGFRFLVTQVAGSLPDLSRLQKSGKPILLPPGAIAKTEFYSTCEPFCQECRSACPRDAIAQDAMGFPYIQPEASPCVMCLDVPCTRVCPTNALQPLTEPRIIALGTAVIEVTTCTAFQGSGCRVCYDTCPIPNEAIQIIEGLPQIVPEHCTGCGVCVYECPTPDAISIRPA